MRKTTILWIDDFDTNSSSRIRRREEKKGEVISSKLGIFDEVFRSQVEIKESFFEGVKYIIEKHGEYDCVILDIDMKKNFQQVTMDDSTSEGKVWKRFFEKVHIDMSEVQEGAKVVYTVGSESIESYLGKNAGFFLVVLLLALGFPQDRIVIFSAFGDKNIEDNRTSPWGEKFREACIHKPQIIDKDNVWNNGITKNDALNKFLYDKYNNKYYGIRMFVFKLYNHLNEYFDEVIKREGEFNPLFNYLCKRSDKKLKVEYIRGMLDNVLFYFPCFEPEQEKSKIFFNALKQFAEPFEAEFDNRKPKNNSFRVMKLFRNWSAHSLFEHNGIMSDSVFKFLFYIECLMFVEQPKKCSSDNSKICVYDYTVKFVDKLWSDCNWHLNNLIAKEQISIKEMCDNIEKGNWLVCKENNTLPENMIDVYDSIGRKVKEKMKYKYLMDAYINIFIEKNISYGENGCRTKYSFKYDGNNKEMNEALFCMAYNLYKNEFENDV